MFTVCNTKPRQHLHQQNERRWSPVAGEIKYILSIDTNCGFIYATSV